MISESSRFEVGRRYFLRWGGSFCPEYWLTATVTARTAHFVTFSIPSLHIGRPAVVKRLKVTEAEGHEFATLNSNAWDAPEYWKRAASYDENK